MLAIICLCLNTFQNFQLHAIVDCEACQRGSGVGAGSGKSSGVGTGGGKAFGEQPEGGKGSEEGSEGGTGTKAKLQPESPLAFIR